ncbi:MAG TPA: hypothetical protein VN444_03530, partial [Verrucomicrobiae bacterium]|nr:hypothetical protein [Verrucomicrobiae bacterium]
CSCLSPFYWPGSGMPGRRGRWNGIEQGTVRMPYVLAERAASEGPRSTRAVKGIPTIPFQLLVE